MDSFWDYNNGNKPTEIKMGRALRDGYRQKAFLTTKLDARAKQAAASQVEQSLRRPRTDHMDVLQVNEPPMPGLKNQGYEGRQR